METLSGTGRVIIIGAGHNGLVTAAYLAKAGFAPLVLERKQVVGGMAVTEELSPGFRCSPILQTADVLPQITKDLDLAKNGVKVIRAECRILALTPDGLPIHIYDDAQRTAGELARISARDAESYRVLHASLADIGHVLRPLLSMTPPDIDNPTKADYLNMVKLGLKLRRLDKRDGYRILRYIPMAIADLVSEWFETDLLRAAIAARGIWGVAAGPRSPGTSAGVLLQAAIDGYAVPAASFIAGGIGSLTRALEKAATAAGATIRTGADVRLIRVKDGRVAAIVLATGEEIAATAVISNADPRRTFLTLLDPMDLQPSFLRKIQNYRSAGCVGKINLALSGLPNFPQIASRMYLSGGIDYLEQAFDASKYGEYSAAPFMDVTIPSLEDASLAPAGGHVMSVHVQYAPYHLKNGSWIDQREQFVEVVLNELGRYAPNIRELIIERQVLAPPDLENQYGLSGGHILHGEHALDQLFVFRPVLGSARYRTPVKGLYLCGAGSHPGGGLTGAPGFNASREVIKDLKSR